MNLDAATKPQEHLMNVKLPIGWYMLHLSIVSESLAEVCAAFGRKSLESAFQLHANGRPIWGSRPIQEGKPRLRTVQGKPILASEIVKQRHHPVSPRAAASTFAASSPGGPSLSRLLLISAAKATQINGPGRFLDSAVPTAKPLICSRALSGPQWAIPGGHRDDAPHSKRLESNKYSKIMISAL
jgi:hypothetical protein